MELRQSVKYMKRYTGEDYTFVINRVKLDDRGEYIIRAENSYGAREEPVFLNVQRKSSVIFLLLNHTIYALFSSTFLYIYIFFYSILFYFDFKIFTV